MSPGAVPPPLPSSIAVPLPQTLGMPRKLLERAWEPQAEDILENPGRYVSEGFKMDPPGAIAQGILAAANLPRSILNAGVLDPLVGVANLFGAQLPKADSSALLNALAKKIGGTVGLAEKREFKDIYRDDLLNLKSAEEQMGWLGSAANAATGMAGWVVGTFNPYTISGKAFGGIAGVTSAIGRRVVSGSTWMAKAAQVASKATAFGALEAIRAIPERNEQGEAVDAEGKPVTDLGVRLRAGMAAAATFPLYEGAGKLAHMASAAWLKKAIDGDKALAAPLLKWAQAALESGKLQRFEGEGGDQLLERATNAWIKLGMPGAGKVTTKKLLAAAIETPIEGLGISALDAEWRKDGYDAVFRGDHEAALKFAERTLTNTLGIAMLKTGSLAKTYDWQRKQPTPPDQPIDRAGAPDLPPGEGPFPPPGPPGPMAQRAQDAKAGFEHRLEMKSQGAVADQMAAEEAGRARGTDALERAKHRRFVEEQSGAAQDEAAAGEDRARSVAERERDAHRAFVTKDAKDTKSEADFVASHEKLRNEALLARDRGDELTDRQRRLIDRDPSIADVTGEERVETQAGESAKQEPQGGDALSGKLQRLGWRPKDGGVEMPGTPYHVVVQGGVATFSPKLASVLGVKQPLPWEQAQQVLEVASLINAMHSKLVLPGQPVRTDAVHGEARPGRDGRLLSFRFGEAYESPLGPDEKWSKIDPPDQKPEPVPQAQREIAEALAELRLSRPDLSPVAEALLDKLIQTVGGVTAANDPGLQDAVDLLRHGNFLEAIATNPEQSLRDLAHIITNAAPETLLSEQMLMQATAPVEKTQAEFTGQLEKGSPERARAVKAHRKAVGEAVARGDEVKPEVLADYPELQGQSEAFGGVIPPVVGRAMERAAGGAKDIASRVLDYDVSKLVRRVRTRGEPEVANKLGEVVSQSKDYRARMNNQAASYYRTLSRKVTKALTERKFADGRSLWTTYHVAMDQAAREHFGMELSELPAEARAAVEQAHELFFESGKVMEDAGARVKNLEGQPAFTADKGRWRMVRSFTPAMREALFQKSGALYQAFVEEVTRLNGMEQQDGQAKVAALLERGVIRRDAAEFKREFKLMPDAILIDGRPIEILESRPYDQVKGMVEHTALRAGFGKVFGWDAAVGEGDARPMPALEVVQKAKPEAQDAIKDAFRAANGMPIEAAENFGMVPGSRAHDLWTLGGALMRLWRAGKLTRSWIVNIPEITGAAATYLGGRNMARAVAEAVRDLAGGRLHGTLDRLSAAGIFTRDVRDWSVQGKGAERVEDVARVLAQGLTAPLQFVQEYLVEMPMALAVEKAEAQMRAGDGSLALLGMLKGMDVSDARARAMIQGQGTAAEYAAFRRSGIQFLAGGTTGHPLEATRSEHSRAWRRILFFSGYFRRRMDQMRGIKDSLVEAITEKDAGKGAEATLMLARFVGGAALSGTLGQMLVSLWKDGLSGPAQYVRESLEDPSEYAWNVLVSSLFGGIGGAVLQAAKASSTEGKDTLPTLVNMLGPATAAKEFADFAMGMLPHPDSTSPYAGMSMVEKVSAFAQKMLPIARDVDRGLFGLDMLALGTDDTKRDAALSAYYHWRHANVPFDPPPADRTTKEREFRSAMKEASRHLRDGEMPDVYTSLKNAAKATDWKGVRASLLQRRIFDQDWKKLPADQRQGMASALGHDNMAVLRAYDQSIERLAAWAKR